MRSVFMWMRSPFLMLGSSGALTLMLRWGFPRSSSIFCAAFFASARVASPLVWISWSRPNSSAPVRVASMGGLVSQSRYDADDDYAGHQLCHAVLLAGADDVFPDGKAIDLAVFALLDDLCFVCPCSDDGLFRLDVFVCLFVSVIIEAMVFPLKAKASWLVFEPVYLPMPMLLSARSSWMMLFVMVPLLKYLLSLLFCR